MITDQGKLANSKQCDILVFVARLDHPNVSAQKPNTIAYSYPSNRNHCSASIITPTPHAILVIFSLFVARFVPIQRMYIIGRRNEKPVTY
jgi:hypothetical protein